MTASRRPGISLSGLLVVLAILALLAGLLLPAIMRVRRSAEGVSSANNLSQIGLAVISYESTAGVFPSGNDKNNLSVIAHVREFLELENLAKIDMTKPVDDPANAEARKVRFKILVSPKDPQPTVNEFGPTNYLFIAGSKPGLVDNDGVFYQDSRISIPQIKDGASNTVIGIETLKGDGGNKAETVQRQHVRLGKDTLKDLKDDSGVSEWKDDKNIAGDRCASWMDGRFLQTTWTATRLINDPRPDVDCEGQGGLSAIRSPGPTIVVLYCDRSVRNLNPRIDLKVLKALTTRAGGEEASGDE